MSWKDILDWISDHKDALGWLFGTGVLGAALTGLYRLVRGLIQARRERQLRSPESPFQVFPPGSNLLPVIMPGPEDSPLSDHRIPYVERVPGRSVRREMEDLLLERRALLVCGKSGLGKTREAVHLAQMLNNEGWTVLFLPPGAWLESPARLPQGVPNRKVLLFLDDLSRRCYSARREVNPRAESLAQPLTRPFQERLLETIEAFEAFCGKSELLILATTRNERTPEYEGEPAEWDKLEWERYRDLWSRFACYELPEPHPQVAAGLLSERGEAAGVRVEAPETLARRNDGTLRNLVENLRTAVNPERGLPALTPETFVDTLRGTWQERYRRACERYPAEAPALYWSAALLRRYGFPLEARTLLPLARELLGRGRWWSKIIRLRRALRYLTLHEGLTTPRDGQLEAAGPPPIATQQVIEALIRVGFRYRLAEALYTLAGELMWPDKTRSSVYHPAAVRILRQVTEWQPEKPGAWYYLGVALADSGEREQAIAAYQKAIELDAKENTFWYNLGLVYGDLGRNEETTAAFQKAIELDLNDAYPWNGLGIICLAQEMFEEAIKHFIRALEIDPKFKWAYANLGDVYRKQGRQDEAIAAYQKAIELDPKYASAWQSLRIVYESQEKYDQAIEQYVSALENGLSLEWVYADLEDLCRKYDCYQVAIDTLQKAIERQPKVAALWNGLGNVYCYEGRYKDAIAAYRRAIELDPQNAISWKGLGNVYTHQGYYKKAILAYQKAVELDPKDTASWDSLGKIYRTLGNYNKFLELYRYSRD